MEGFNSFIVDLFDGGMNVEVSRPGTDQSEEFLKLIFRNTSFRSPESRWSSDMTKIISNINRSIIFSFKNFLIISFIDIPKLISKILEIVLINDTFF